MSTQPRIQPAAVTTQDSQRDALRDGFLAALAHEAPDAQRELRALLAPDDAAITAWAERWHVSAPWVRDAARDYWRDCAAHPAHADDFRLAVVEGGWRPLKPAAAPTWDVYRETEAAFRKRMDDYIAAVTRQIDDAGTTDHIVPVRRNPAVFARLVRYQVLGWTLTDTAGADGLYGASKHTDVMKSLKTLARAIDLPLRAAPRGRPPRQL